MNAKFDELVTRMQTAQGNNLVSIIVHGSAIAAPGNAKKADYQTLFVTKKLNAGDLRRARQVVDWWLQDGYPMPVFFTEKEIDKSLDVFPIEFGHMKNAYNVLYGKDVLADKKITKTSLRWQTEHELRGKLLRLRSLYLPASLTTRELTKLMTNSIVTFVRFLRPVLELFGEEPPLGRLATVKQVSEKLKIDPTPLVRILQLRDEPKEIMDIEAQDLFAGYLECIESVIDKIDKMSA